MKNKFLKLIPISFFALTPMVIVTSCSTNSTTNSPEFQNNIDQLFQENKLSFNFKNPVITEEIFQKYQNDLEKISIAFELKNETDLQLDWTIEKLSLENNLLKVNILIKNSEGQVASKTIELNGVFNQKQNYIDGVYRAVQNNLKLKPEYSKTKLLDLFAKTKTEKDIQDLFLIDDYLDVNVELNFASQSINDEEKMKYTIIMKDDQGNILKPSTVNTLYFQFDNDLIQPVTLLMQSDLKTDANSDNNRIPNGYYGKTFLIKDLNDSKLIINQGLGSKNITESLDFTNFNEIEFRENASFSGNQISDLKFDLSAKVSNLKSGLFTSNKIKTVELPLNIDSFNIGAFDSETVIKNLDQVSDLKKFYDATTKTIYLNKVDPTSEESGEEPAKLIEQMLKLVAQSQGGDKQTVDVNSIVLPAFQFNTNFSSTIKIKTKTIEFNSQAVNKNIQNTNDLQFEEFKTNISNWEIEKINIPDSVILIDEEYLPKNEKTIITRTLNNDVLGLIKNNQLDLKTKLGLLKTKLNLASDELFNNLASDYKFLDKLFYSFSSQVQHLQALNKIMISDTTSNTTLTMSDFSGNLKFFKDLNNGNKNSKTVEIDKKYQKIDISGFNYFRSNLKSSNITLIRQKNDDFSWLDQTGKLSISQFQNQFSESKESEPYKILRGLEEQIKSIDVTGVTKINNNLFYELDFSSTTNKTPLQMDLTKVTQIGTAAFYYTRGLSYTTTSSDKWTSVGARAFYSSGLTGDLNLSGLTTIEESAFQSNSLSSVTLGNNLTTIGNSAFQYNSLTSITLPSSLKTIGTYAFASNSSLTTVTNNATITEIPDGLFQSTGLTTFDFTNVTKVGSYAFSGSKLTGAFDLSKLTEIGSSAFSNIPTITSVKWNSKITEIPDYLFQNTGLTTFNFSGITKVGSSAFSGSKLANTIDLSSVKTINNQAFSNTAIATLKLKNDAEIANDAFTNIATLTSVENFNFQNLKIEDLFSADQISKINFNVDANSLNSLFHYDQSNKKLDLSSLSKWDKEYSNKFKIFLKDKTEFSEVILPTVEQQNYELMNLILNSNATINKLTWKTDNVKTMNFSLANKTNIKSLDPEFTLGMNSIPERAFTSLQLNPNQKLNLNTVTSVGAFAFSGSNINNFEHTSSIKTIAQYAFNYQTQMQLPDQVEIDDNAFSATSDQPVLPPTVTQNKRITKGEYLKIYDPNTKILDFTKADPVGKYFDDKSKWTSYLNIGKYLVRGDVDKIILPPVYVIWTELVDNLSDVKEIVFQKQNQQIMENAFAGTTIKNKPQQNQTNVIFDDAGFFENNN